MKLLEASPGIEPGYTDLQSAASPLRHEASEVGLLKTTEPLIKFVFVSR